MGPGGRAPRLRSARHLRLAVDQPRRLRDARALRRRPPSASGSARASSRRSRATRRWRRPPRRPWRSWRRAARWSASAAATARPTTSAPRPVSLAELREYAVTIRGLLTDGARRVPRRHATFTWSRARVPIYLAASGPKTLRLAGQIADGVVIRTGHRARDRPRLHRPGARGRARGGPRSRRASTCGGGPTSTWRASYARRGGARSRCRWPWRATT